MRCTVYVYLRAPRSGALSPQLPKPLKVFQKGVGASWVGPGWAVGFL